MIWGLFFIFADKGMTFMLFWDYIPFFFNSSSFSVSSLSLRSPSSVVPTSLTIMKNLFRMTI